MMGDQYFEDVGLERAEPLLDIPDLLLADTAPAEMKRAGGVNSENRDFLVHVERLGIRADVLAIEFEADAKSPDDVAERQVVVSGHSEARLRQLMKEIVRGAELVARSVLNEVAGDDRHVRTNIPGGFDDRFHHSGRDAAEVDIREMDQDADGTPPSSSQTNSDTLLLPAGTMARSARGQDRN